ncbi:MAG: hypothetical protein IJI09_10220 [Clostridia bacterium]|nr:hypothetical protein [Clostridia bacterium]
MAYAVKESSRVQAWELGAGSVMEQEMIRCRKIVPRPGGIYEIFSREATGKTGQIASAGDFFKVDNYGFPHPWRKAAFLQQHQFLEGDWYQEAARRVKIWRLSDPVCEEIRFLLNRGILRIDPGNPDRCFTALIWGTEETAVSDAVVVILDTDRGAEGCITGVNFNFVEIGYFNKHYRVIES